MAAVVAPGSAMASSWIQLKNSSKKVGNNAAKNKKFRVSSSVRDPYRTLRIHPGASESEVKKAFWQLALQQDPFLHDPEKADYGFDFSAMKRLARRKGAEMGWKGRMKK